MSKMVDRKITSMEDVDAVGVGQFGDTVPYGLMDEIQRIDDAVGGLIASVDELARVLKPLRHPSVDPEDGDNKKDAPRLVSEAVSDLEMIRARILSIGYVLDDMVSSLRI